MVYENKQGLYQIEKYRPRIGENLYISWLLVIGYWLITIYYLPVTSQLITRGRPQ